MSWTKTSGLQFPLELAAFQRGSVAVKAGESVKMREDGNFIWSMLNHHAIAD